MTELTSEEIERGVEEAKSRDFCTDMINGTFVCKTRDKELCDYEKKKLVDVCKLLNEINETNRTVLSFTQHTEFNKTMVGEFKKVIEKIFW